MKHTLCILLFVYLVSTLPCADPGLAADGLALLKRESTARAAGLAGAATTLSDGASAALYNPSLASQTAKSSVSFGYNTHLASSGITHAAGLTQLDQRFTIFGTIRHAYISDLEARTTPSIVPDNTFGSFDAAFKGGVSMRISPLLSMGVSFGWFIEKIADYRGSAANVDLGAVALPAANLRVGLSFLNLGSDFRLESPGKPSSRDITLPRTVRAGASYSYGRFLGSLDLVHLDDKAHVHVGLESALHEVASVRAGVATGYDSQSFAMGASFRKYDMTLDYAFVPYSNSLGDSHVVSLSFQL